MKWRYSRANFGNLKLKGQLKLNETKKQWKMLSIIISPTEESKNVEISQKVTLLAEKPLKNIGA